MEEYYKQIQNECEGFVFFNVEVTSVKKILKILDVAKASRINQVSAKILKDDAPVIATDLTNIINLPIKLDTFPSKRKIAKKALCLKKKLRLKLRTIDLFLYWP